MNLAICDDEPLFIQSFRQQLSECSCLSKLPYTLSVFTDGEQLLEADKRFDIIFLDIKMDGLSGLETARRLRSAGVRSILVFLTAYRQYVFQAFDVDASQYLIKPVETEKLNAVVSRLSRRVAEKEDQFLTVSHSGSTERIRLGDIRYIEVMDRKVYVHMDGGGVMDFYQRIEQLEKTLPSWFFRCHRSYIVNLDMVGRFDRTTVTLADGKCIPLSKRKYSAFSMAFMQRNRRD